MRAGRILPRTLGEIALTPGGVKAAALARAAILSGLGDGPAGTCGSGPGQIDCSKNTPSPYQLANGIVGFTVDGQPVWSSPAAQHAFNCSSPAGMYDPTCTPAQLATPEASAPYVAPAGSTPAPAPAPTPIVRTAPVVYTTGPAPRIVPVVVTQPAPTTPVSTPPVSTGSQVLNDGMAPGGGFSVPSFAGVFSFLATPIGPLPLWMWGAAGVGALMLFGGHGRGRR